MDFIFDKKESWPNIHIFQVKHDKSLCGREFKSEGSEYLNDPMSDSEARQYAVELQNNHENVCGQCVARLYHDENE